MNRQNPTPWWVWLLPLPLVWWASAGLALRWDARPSKYAFALLHQVAGGGATAGEILPILAERERRCALDRASQRRRREEQAEARRS